MYGCALGLDSVISFRISHHLHHTDVGALSLALAYTKQVLLHSVLKKLVVMDDLFGHTSLSMPCPSESSFESLYPMPSRMPSSF